MNNPLTTLIEILELKRLQGEAYLQISSENTDYLKGHQPSPRPQAPISMGEVVPDVPEKPHCRNAMPVTQPVSVPPVKRPDHLRNPPLKTTGQPSKFRSIVVHPVNRKDLNVSFPELKEIAATCTECGLCHGRSQRVFGKGNLNAKLMIVGDGPGLEEDRTGIPLSDEAGKLFDKILKAMKFSRDEVYITNVTKCCPAIKRPPSDNEAAMCLPILKREIELIKPEVIVLFGPLPLRHLLNEQGLMKWRGTWLSYNGIACMPTHHPTYLLRVAGAKKDVWADMQKVMRKFGKI